MTVEQLEQYIVSEVENLHLKFDSMFDRVLNEIAALHERFNRSDRLLNDRVDAVELRMDTLEARVDSIEVRLGNLEVRLNAIEVRLGNLEVRVDAIEARLDSLEEKVDNGFAAIAKQFGLISATQVQILARLDNLDQSVRALA